MLTEEEKLLRNINTHNFDEWSKKLIDTPFIHDPWAVEQVGENNEGPYRAGYENIEVRENNEEIVDVSWYGLASNDYYLTHFLMAGEEQEEVLNWCLKMGYIFPTARVRKTIAERLQKVDKELRKHDLRISINSGWRHPELQKIAKEWRTKQYGSEYANKILATKSPHATGGSVDITLWSMQHNRDMTFSYPGNNFCSFYLERKENLDDVEKAKRAVRRIMLHTMCTPGICLDEKEVFVNHPGEYWHFGWGDPMSAYLARQPYAIFGSVVPRKQYKLED